MRNWKNATLVPIHHWMPIYSLDVPGRIVAPSIETLLNALTFYVLSGISISKAPLCSDIKSFFWPDRYDISIRTARMWSSPLASHNTALV